MSRFPVVASTAPPPSHFSTTVAAAAGRTNALLPHNPSALRMHTQQLPSQRRDMAPFAMRPAGPPPPPALLPPFHFDSYGAPAAATKDTRILSTSSSQSLPAQVDAMDWSVSLSSSPSPMDQHHEQRRRVPFSILLNPSDDKLDGEQRFQVLSPSASNPGSESVTPMPATATAMTTPTSTAITTAAMPPQPKRRGRKPHLPKMNNSERGKYYRNKRKRYGDTLTGDVKSLREDIERLRAMHQIYSDLSLNTRMSLPGSLGKLVREYFAQFRHGVQLPPSRRNMALPDVEISTTQQTLFINATMEHDVGFGEYRGVETIMDQWQRYSQYHALLTFDMSTMQISGPESTPIIVADGFLRTRYSRKTIENVFPHVAGNEPLIQRLIGKEIVYPFRNQFYFTEQGRVERYDVEADFVAAMVTALGSTEDAALLLGQALIQKQHMMGVLDEDDEPGGSIGSSTGGMEKSRSPRFEVEYLLDDDGQRVEEKQEDGSRQGLQL